MNILQQLIDTIASKLRPKYSEVYIATALTPMHKLSTCQGFMDDLRCQGYKVSTKENDDYNTVITVCILGTPSHYELTLFDDLGDPAVSMNRVERLGYYVEEL